MQATARHGCRLSMRTGCSIRRRFTGIDFGHAGTPLTHH
jgi:hypothetical protein